MDGSLDLRTRRNLARHVSELDLLDIQKEGQELYRQKKYEEALKCFDEVPNLQHHLCNSSADEI